MPQQFLGEQGKRRTLRLPGPTFIGRFVQHVLPSGLKRIRHHGLLANANEAKLVLAKAASHMPMPNPVAQENAQDFMARVAQIDASQCPACEHGRLRVVQTCQGRSARPIRWPSGVRMHSRSHSRINQAMLPRRKGREHEKTRTTQPAKARMAPSRVGVEHGSKRRECTKAGRQRPTAIPPTRQPVEVAATKVRQRVQIDPTKGRPVGIMKAHPGVENINPL